MTYDDWKTTEPDWFEDRYTDEPEWPGLDACPDCGYLLLPEEAPHSGGLCSPAVPRTVPVLAWETCPKCVGTGVLPTDGITMCPACPGTGTIF